MKKVIKVCFAFILAILLVVSVLIIRGYIADNNVAADNNQGVVITVSQYLQIHRGMTLEEVDAILGAGKDIASGTIIYEYILTTGETVHICFQMAPDCVFYVTNKSDVNAGTLVVLLATILIIVGICIFCLFRLPRKKTRVRRIREVTE